LKSFHRVSSRNPHPYSLRPQTGKPSDDLRREFPYATIMTINLAALLEALDEAVECHEV
jgi:hypothetical protein